MAVVDNVIKFKPKSMTTVSIEESDESWALKLLSEDEPDKQYITVKAKHSEKSSTNTTASFLSCDEPEDFNSDDLALFDASMLSLSAIENQKLALAKKDEELMREKDSATLSTGLIFDRIKGVLNYDLFSFMKRV